MKTAISAINAVSDWLIQKALAVLMSVLVVSISWQVTSRYFFRDPSSWTEELARFALIWSGFLGATYAYRTRAHISIDILETRLSSVDRKKLRAFVALAVIGFTIAVMIVGGLNLVFITHTLKQSSAALGVPMWWIYTIIPVSGTLIVLYALDELVHDQSHQTGRGGAD